MAATSIPATASTVTRGKTSRELLFEKHNELCSQALSLMHSKNQDYADEGDAFANFHEFGRFGILVRLSDKFKRLKNYEQRGTFAVKDEGLEDTLRDIINYIVLYAAYPQGGK